jgi:hypothetical protein
MAAVSHWMFDVRCRMFIRLNSRTSNIQHRTPPASSREPCRSVGPRAAGRIRGGGRRSRQRENPGAAAVPAGVVPRAVPRVVVVVAAIQAALRIVAERCSSGDALSIPRPVTFSTRSSGWRSASRRQCRAASRSACSPVRSPCGTSP